MVRPHTSLVSRWLSRFYLIGSRRAASVVAAVAIVASISAVGFLLSPGFSLPFWPSFLPRGPASPPSAFPQSGCEIARNCREKRLDRYIYVDQDPSEFWWEDSANRIRDKAPKGWWTGYILRVTTHRWFNRTVSDRIQWWHWMTVIAPDDMHNAHKGLVLFVIGSGWSQFHYYHLPDKDEMFTAAFAPLVVELGILGAVLHQQPMEPITFLPGINGPGKSVLEEDELMALGHGVHVWDGTWGTGCMCGMGRGARDACVGWHGMEQVEGFVLMGVSKRGLMAWLTAAMDKRVVGIVAYGFDLLDFGRNFQHLHDSLGAWPVILKFYAIFNVTSQLQSPEFTRLMEDTDPFYYRERLTMPKLLVSAANDEVLALDDTYIWWNDMPEPKLLKIMANSEHMQIHVNQWANQATLSFLASLLHVNSSCAALPTSSRPSLTWTRPSNTAPSPSRRKRFDKTEGTGLFAREERETAEAQAGPGGGVEGSEGDALTNQEQPAHPWSCVPELPAVDWPRLRWRFDWPTFTIHATSDRKPLAVRAWTGKTASERRDFRFVLQRGSKGCTAPMPTVPGTYAGKFDLCIQATPFFLHTISPPKHHPDDGLWHFSSTISDVPKVGFRAFWIEADFAIPQRKAPFVLTTEAILAPNKLPFSPCQPGNYSCQHRWI
ncbi:unnamed protein product [Closterium sp. Yama58-4]|nr:unnamed protein product [Closterium sp. Yama58-4]